MTVLQRIMCFILSLTVLYSCGLATNQPPQRVVRVNALAGPSFRARNASWPEELRARIEAASVYFEREFDIRFVTTRTAAWPESDQTPSTTGRLAKLREDFPLDGKNRTYDLIIAFTADPPSRYLASGRPRVSRIGNCQEGLGHYLVTTVSGVFRDAPEKPNPGYDTAVLIHELGHVFGAEHVNDINSIMHEKFDHRLAFDMKNRSVILRNRNCPFTK